VSEFLIEASRAVEPYYYRAPAPETSNGDVPAEYQFAGAEYCLGLDDALVGDAPGVGKTLEAILIGNAIEAKSNLVVCPASLRLNWEREIWKWSMLENVSTYPIMKSRDGVSLMHDYVIISYNLLTNNAILDAIMERHWDHLILDEAHALKDPKGNTRTKVICAPDLLPSVVGRITMLSGTILPNQPIECYNAIRLLNHDAIGRMSVDSFRNHFYEEGEGFVRGPVLVTEDEQGKPCEPHWETKLHWSDKVRNVPVNLGELQDILRGNLMVRRIKEQVLHELPEKRWHPFPIEPNADIRKALKHPGWAQAEKLYEMDPDGFTDHGAPVDGAISTAHRELGEAKAPAVAAYIEDLLAEGVTKIVVGAWHRTVLEYLRERLKKHGLVYMDGRTSSTRKQNVVDQFQEREEIKIILGQIIPLGEGWTLTAAQDVVAAELYWVSGKLDQLFDRISRRGQLGSYTLGHMPVVPGSLEEKMLHRVIEKDIVINATLDKEH
jgi:SWI/SNF-related matrix-associated actin-dependent regulator 1 of chromatin subfamily A